MFKKIVALVLGITMLFTLAACGGNDTANTANSAAPAQAAATESATPTGSTSAEKPIRLGLVTQAKSNPFHIQLGDAAIAAAKEAGVEMTILASASMEEQLKVMEDLAQTKPDAIAVTSYDAKGIVPAMEAAKAMGIAVYAVDNNCTDTDITAFIGTDNVYGGEVATKWILDKIGGKGKIGLILGTAGSFASNARKEGFYNILKEYPDIKVIEVTANWKRDQALTVANDILTANPDVKCIFGLNDDMALGAVQAVETAGKRRNITVIGYNGTPDAVMAVYKGELDATVVQFPETMAKTYVDTAIALTREGKQPDKQYLIPAVVVDTALIRSVVDDGKKPTTELEELIYAKLIKFVKGK